MALIMENDTFDQAQLLEGMLIDIKEHSYYMRKSIEKEDLKSTLVHVSNIVGELRTSNLSPKYYYQLYMRIFSEMQYFSSFIGDKSKHGIEICDIYDSVQQAGYILPRIYLLTTAGSFYIAQGTNNYRRILNDMTEMCKGVQHPMRGLFLRYYMVQTCKNRLLSSSSTDINSFNDSHDFLLKNFAESSNLWVRLGQNILSIKERKKRETERLELGMLVSTNLVCIAQLDGLDYNIYAKQTLPFIISQITSIGDQKCLQYLIDCVIQAFSDEFHLKTLNELLETSVLHLSPENLNSILINLMDRLLTFILNNPKTTLEGLNIFGIFQSNINKVNIANAKIESVLQLQYSFLKFTINLYPGLWEHIENILDRSLEIMEIMNVKDLPPSVDAAINIITISTEALGISFLKYPYIEKFLNFFSFEAKIEVSCRVMDIISTKFVTSISQLKSLINACNSIFVPSEEENCEILPKVVRNNLVRQQQMVWKLLRAIASETPSEELDMILFVQNKILDSGYRRCELTIPSIVNRYLELVSNICSPGGFISRASSPTSDPGRRWNHESPISPISNGFPDLCHTIYRLINTGIQSIVLTDPQSAIKLSILVAISANECNGTFNEFEQECCEFITDALIYFEDYIVDSEQQMDLLKYISGALSTKINYISPQDMESLMSRVIKSGYKFLRKRDKCRSILIASHMYWNNNIYKNPMRVWECFSKCREIANSGLYTTQTDHCNMLIDLYDKAIYYTKMKVDMFNNKLLKELETEIQSLFNDNKLNEAQVNRFEMLKRESNNY